MIYTLGGIKGGTGKTTLATNLAIMLSRAQRDVLLVDADDQGTATLFTARRNEVTENKAGYSAIRLREMDVYQQVMNLKSRFSDIVIDTGGRDTKSQRSAIIVSDIYILPFRPRSFDLWTIYDSINVIEESKMINPNLQAVAVLNQADFKSSLENEETKKMFLEDEKIRSILDLIDAPLSIRKAFATAAASGLAVVEQKTKDYKAIAEMQRFYDVVTQLKK
jgi:chromosome partitioning protein